MLELDVGLVLVLELLRVDGADAGAHLVVDEEHLEEDHRVVALGRLAELLVLQRVPRNKERFYIIPVVLFFLFQEKASRLISNSQPPCAHGYI